MKPYVDGWPYSARCDRRPATDRQRDTPSWFLYRGCGVSFKPEKLRSGHVAGLALAAPLALVVADILPGLLRQGGKLGDHVGMFGGHVLLLSDVGIEIVEPEF